MTTQSPSPQDSVDELARILQHYKEYLTGVYQGITEYDEATAKLALTKWRDAAIRNVLVELDGALPEKREGIKEYKDKDGEAYHTCLYCGGYDECDCEGFNEALSDVHTLIRERLNDGS